MNKTAGFVIFAFGVMIGMALGGRIVKTQYEKELNDRDQYIRNLRSKKQVSEIIEVNGYIPTDDKNEEENERQADMPYVISPEDFGEFEGTYTMVSLTYYEDGTVTDENDNIIENAEGILGKGFSAHFGEYEDDSVFIRNDSLKCDYEILRVLRRYKENT